MESENKLNEVKVVLKLEDGSDTLYSERPINNPQAANEVMSDVLKRLDRETLVVVNLNSQLQPINYNVVSVGNLDEVGVDVSSVLKSSLLSNAKSIMVMHNHPSGNVMPSKGDMKRTENIIRGAKLLDIDVADSIIVGGRNGTRYSIRNSYPRMWDTYTDTKRLFNENDASYMNENVNEYQENKATSEYNKLDESLKKAYHEAIEEYIKWSKDHDLYEFKDAYGEVKTVDVEKVIEINKANNTTLDDLGNYLTFLKNPDLGNKFFEIEKQAKGYTLTESDLDVYEENIRNLNPFNYKTALYVPVYYGSAEEAIEYHETENYRLSRKELNDLRKSIEESVNFNNGIIDITWNPRDAILAQTNMKVDDKTNEIMEDKTISYSKYVRQSYGSLFDVLASYGNDNFEILLKNTMRENPNEHYSFEGSLKNVTLPYFVNERANGNRYDLLSLDKDTINKIGDWYLMAKASPELYISSKFYEETPHEFWERRPKVMCEIALDEVKLELNDDMANKVIKEKLKSYAKKIPLDVFEIVKPEWDSMLKEFSDSGNQVVKNDKGKSLQ